MNVGAPLVAHTQPSVLVEPCERALDEPACLSQAAAVLASSFRDERKNSTRLEPLAQRLTVVGRVCLDAAGFAFRRAAFAAHWRNFFKERLELGDVVNICAGEDDSEWDAVGISENVVFAAWTRAIGGIWAAFFPPRPRCGRLRSRPVRGTSRCGRRRATGPGLLHATRATRPPHANLAGASSTSCPIRTPFPAAGPPRECPSSGRRGCPSGRLGLARACGPESGIAAADRAAGAVR